MRRVQAAIWLGALLLAAAPAHAQVTLSLACSGLGTEGALCREGAEEWAARGGHRVRLVSLPNRGTERLALLRQLLAAGSRDIDVLQIDAVWTGMLADHLLDLAPHLDTEGQLDQALRNNTVAGRLVAMPWFTGAGLLYYRRDLLEAHGHPPPETWQALTRTAEAIQHAEPARPQRLWGFVFQGRAYEGLTVNALEWLASHGADGIVAEDGRVAVADPRAARVLALARSWIGTIAPQGVLTYAEEEARAVFQSGNAVFMRNWPYAWALLNAPDSPVAGRVGVARLPRGEGPEGRHAAVLGGEQLAVSRHGAHPALAIDLVRHLTSRAEQRRRAILGAFPPTYPDLYADAEVLAANPVFAQLPAVLRGGVARPAAATGRHYSRVSANFAYAVHDVLAGRAAPAAALDRLRARLQRLAPDGAW